MTATTFANPISAWINNALYCVAALGALAFCLSANAEPRSDSGMRLNGKSLNDANTQGVCSVNIDEGPATRVLDGVFPLHCAFDENTIAPDEYKDARLWAYSNENGSVHTGLDGDDWVPGTFIEAPTLGDRDYDLLDVHLVWNLPLIIDGSASIHKLGFTLNPGFLEHRIYRIAGVRSMFDPVTHSNFEVMMVITPEYDSVIYGDFLCDITAGNCYDGEAIRLDEFKTFAEVSGYTNEVQASFLTKTCESFVCLNTSDDPIWASGRLLRGTSFKMESKRHKGELGVSGLVGGEEARVRYDLNLIGVAANDGRGSRAKLSDPLDPFDPANPVNSPVLEIEGLLPNTTEEENACNETLAPNRYEISNDATVLDTYTGLMWQRCPLNHTLSAGDPDFINDDRCVPDSVNTERVDWPQSLQGAAGNSLANHSDWQLPNAKQLQSIVSACGPVAIDRIAFPDTPADHYWSSTPTRTGEAWAVNFSDGAMQTWPTANLSRARLVRATNEPIVAPKPALRAAFGRAMEADHGTTTVLSLPITLSYAATTDVTVDYAVSSGSAQAGVDFAPKTGTATIVAGQRRTTIDIDVIGETDPERHEYFFLKLSNPSANVAMARHLSLGRIIDDDRVYPGVPRIALQLEEGDAGLPNTLDIPITLSQPAKGHVSIEYSTRGDTAIAGIDYLTTSGTLSFSVGEQEKFITVTSVGNDAWENDRNLYIDLSNPLGMQFRNGFDTAEVNVRLVDDDGVAHGTGLNDTGPPECRGSCPDLAGLDSETGRDATADDDTNGIDGYAFTKLDASGQPLINQQGSDPWDCVADQVTGLTWEVKLPSDPSNPNIRNAGSTFSWYNSSAVNTKSIVGEENAGVCEGGVDCDTEKYVASMNALGLCGFTDWRLPGVDELSNIVYDGGAFYGPTLDTNYFPFQVIGASNFSRSTWTASPVIGSEDLVYVWNSLGISKTRVVESPFGGLINKRYVRLVRGDEQR